MDLLIYAVLLFSLQTKPETVALVFGSEPVRIEIVKTSEAEKLYSELKPKHEAGTLTESEKKTFAALTIALGTIDDPELRTFARHDHERFRWMREPLQNPRKLNF